MKITKLSLTNFRSFKETQTIEFAPLTLLFGPNSVGKSTVLMALFYVQQILEKGQCDPDVIEALNDKYVGGFKNLVHGRDLNKTIKIKVEFDKEGRIGSSYSSIADLFEDIYFGISSPAEEAKTMSVELDISWSEPRKTAYISRYRVAFDGINIAEVTSDSGLNNPMVTAVNYLHPLLLPSENDEWLKERYEFGSDIHEAQKESLCNELGLTFVTDREKAQGAEDPFDGLDDPVSFSDTAHVSEFHFMLTGTRYSEDSDLTAGNDLVDADTFSPVRTINHPLSFSGRSGALPMLGKRIEVGLSFEDRRWYVFAAETLSDLLVAPLDNLKNLLADSLCIGPLRVVPDAKFQTNNFWNQKDWYDGTAAWHHLGKADETLVAKLNQWLLEEDKLNLKYGIATKLERSDFAIVRPSNESLREKYHRFNQGVEALSGGMHFRVTAVNGVPEPSPIYPSKTSTHYSYVLFDSQNNLTVHPNEIGVGMSQVMPLIVASLSRNKGLIACEQPELHVHPRIQVALGDLLTQGNDKAQFLIETHSEHLILRVLRRIRESGSSNYPAGFRTMTTGDISVISLEPTDNGCVVRKFEVTDDGDFEEHWPNGFFEERDEELF